MTELSSYSYSSPSFYVIVDPSVIADRQLRLPDRFVQVHGDELLDTVSLIVPTDDFWRVGLKKAGQMIWLHDGWQEFVEHHSVDCWYFLFFKYRQNSCFNVHIFDLTATEIHYQLKSHGNGNLCETSQALSHGKEKIVGEKDGESSVEIVGPLETELGPESSAKSYELSHRAKRRKIAPGRIKYWRCYETRNRANKWHDNGQVLNPNNLNMVRNNSATKLQLNMDASMCVVVAGDVTNQDNAEEGSKSDTQFIEKKHTESLDAIKAVSSERTNCKTDASKSFTVQQLEKSVRHLWPRKRGRSSAAEVNRAASSAKRFTPKNPNFMQTLEEYNVVRNYVLNIRAEFAREYMPKTSKIIELQDSDGNKWNVRCIRRKNHLCLSKGWTKFVRDKSLVVGDVCVFELIKDIQTNKLILKVYIFRSREEEKLLEDSSLTKHQNMETPAYSAQQGSKNKILQLNERKHMGSPDTSRPASSNRTNCMSDTDKSVTDQQLEKPIRRGRPRKSDRRRRGRPRKTDQPSAAEVNRATSSAKRFRPKNPNFTQTLGEYNVVQNYLLNIPAEFVREYMPKTSETIELQDSDGNKWNVHCLMRKDQLCLSEGWRKFVRDRSLAVGDVCVFELINDIQTDKLMLKVHINRSREKGNLLEDSSLTKPAGGKLLHQNMETPVYSAQQGSKHKILQLDERKHMGSPDASRPLSSNGTNCMSDTSKSFTGQQLEKPIRCGRLKSEQPRAAEENRAIKAAKMFRY